MLDNTITLPVDITNTGTTTDRAYVRYSEFTDRSVYKGPAHTLSLRDTLGFYRTPVKANGSDNGVAKTAVKLTQDISVPGKAASTFVVKPLIADVAFSIPVGATAAQTLELRQRLIAVIDHAISARLVDTLEI